MTNKMNEAQRVRSHRAEGRREEREDAEKRLHCEARSCTGPGLWFDAGDKVCQLHDVGRQEVNRAGDFLLRDDEPGTEGRRRGPEAVQKGDRELQAATGSQEPARWRCKLSGAD